MSCTNIYTIFKYIIRRDLVKLCLLLPLLVFFMLSCTESTPPPSTYKPHASNTCSGSSGIYIDDLEEIDRENASDYRISGECDRNNSEIKVYVEGYPLDTLPLCNREQWEITVDITGIINRKERVQLAASQAGSTGLLCKTVTNYFICPKGYIGVPELDNFARNDFCVMQYEAKVKSGTKLPSPQQRSIIKAEALTKGTLITKVTEEQAKQFCTENGIGYYLITNEEWQTIARHIESVEVNWSEGTTDIKNGNRLNIGNTKGAQNDGDDGEVDDKRWDYHKRSHKLPNNQYIWDFSGNLSEIVDSDDVDISNLSTYDGYIYNIPSELEGFFGPRRNYSILDERERIYGYGGIGYMRGNRYSGTILRGTNTTRAGGIFSTDTTTDSNRTSRTTVGFRCVYRP